MKDVNVLSARSEKRTREDTVSAIVYHIIAAAVGLVSCRAMFLKNYMPFGVAFAAGCPSALLPSAAAGVFIGYFLPALNVSGFKYVAAALAVSAVRFMLSFNKKLTASPLFAALISALSLGVTGAVAYVGIKANLLYLSLEVLACSVLAAVISRGALLIRRLDVGLTGEELGCLLVLAGLLLSGLYGISVFGVKAGCVLAVTLILSACKYGGALSGTVAAIAVSVMFYFAGQSAQTCFIYTVCALCAGLVSSFGKYSQICAFFACAVFLLCLGGINAAAAVVFTETVLGCLFFAFMPKGAGIKLAKIFTCFPQVSVNNDLSRAAALRLKEAAQGIKDVKTTVDEVAVRLEGINTPSFSDVLSAAEREACSGCKMRQVCWEARRDVTLDTVFGLIKQIKAGSAQDDRTFPQEFKTRCLRRDGFTAAVKKSYLNYAGQIAGNGRITAIRQAVTEQFEGISVMLEELVKEFLSGCQFDNSAALNAVGALKNIGVYADECSAPVDKYGRMEIHLKISKNNETVLNRRDIMRVLSLSCERNFAPPVIKKTSGGTFISVSERAEYSVDIGISQKSAKAGDMCGDAYSCFLDGRGHFIMMLSDGMGTGARAAVDSAMAAGLMTRLIKSGFGFECSVRILNSSMLFKSADESLATMDIASIDLHSGAVELYKAGAAPTLVLRSGRAGKAVSTSMPIGILSNVSFDTAGIKLSCGDIVTLISDGAAPDDADWIRGELESFRTGSAQDLAERLTDLAARRRTDGHTDDITVMTAIIKKQ